MTTAPTTTVLDTAPPATAPPSTVLVDPGVTAGPADRLQEGRGTFHRYDNADPLWGERPCAHRTLPKGTVVTVVNTKTGASTWCVVQRPRALRQCDHRPRRGAVRRARAGRGRRDQRAHHLVTLSGRDVSELLAETRTAPEPRAWDRTSSSIRTRSVGSPGLPSVGPGDQVIEIGAGLGSLTLALAETGAAVTAIEVDRGIAPVLRTVVEDKGVRVIEADALPPRLAGACWVTTGGRWWPTFPTTWRLRSSPTCSTACRRSSGCW